MSREINVVLGRILKSCRENKGLTQKNVADLIGVRVNNYQKYEYGTLSASTERIVEFNEIFDTCVICELLKKK